MSFLKKKYQLKNELTNIPQKLEELLVIFYLFYGRTLDYHNLFYENWRVNKILKGDC